METDVPTDPLSALKKRVAEMVDYYADLAKTRQGYAEHYAYVALVKHATSPTDTARDIEKKSTNLAFWHDGSGKEARDALSRFVEIQKLIEQVECGPKVIDGD